MNSKQIKEKRILIVGAGISGLTIGNILSKAGIKVTILEKENQIGGLARSVKYDGFTFDFGPHCIFENQGKAGKFIKELLKDELLVVPKKTGVFLMEKYYNWPLNPEVIIKLPWRVKFNALFDFFYRKKYKGNSLREYLLNRYGKTLYRIDFEPYTKKFLDIDPLNLDPDWMKIGIIRAGAGEKLKMDSLWQVFFSLFRKKSEFFTYPKGGSIQFPLALAGQISDGGGQIIKEAEVTGIESDSNKITSIQTPKGKFYADRFVWTAPITILDKLLFKNTETADGLDYISMIFYNMVVNEKIPTEYRWCYFVDTNIFFPRLSISTLFSPTNSPEGKTSLTVEVTCKRDAEIWNAPQKYQDKIIEDLKRVGVIKESTQVERIYIEKIEYAYPVYRLGYREELARLENKLKAYTNLTLSGRQGTFWYCNMDHCVEQGLDIAYNLINDLNE